MEKELYYTNKKLISKLNISRTYLKGGQNVTLNLKMPTCPRNYTLVIMCLKDYVKLVVLPPFLSKFRGGQQKFCATRPPQNFGLDTSLKYICQTKSLSI